MKYLTLPCANLDLGTAVLYNYIILILNYLALGQCSLVSPELWPRDYGDIAIQEGIEDYDFVVVGAGSAGSVVANRLSENPNWKILLLEAGGDPPIESLIPGLLTTMQQTKYDWNYPIEQSNNYSVFIKDGGAFLRGKMLGGTSSLNGMVYVRGNEGDYNNWEALGNPTWGWDKVLQYFKKSEANHNPEIADAFEGYYHSKNGYLSVELFNNNDSMNSIILQSALEMGIKFLPDVNAKEHVGFTSLQGTIRSGERDSTAKAFLVPAKDRPNLHVMKHSQVLNLEIKDDLVSGVRLNLRGQRELIAHAKKEVILSAGVIGSPQILMLSGIGPESHLQQMGIPLIRDLQVGKNLQDHPTLILVVKLEHSTGLPPTETEFIQNFFQYTVDHTGIFAEIGIGQTQGFVNVHDPLNKYPDFQYVHMIFRKGQMKILSSYMKFFGFVDEIIENVAPEAETSDVLTVAMQNLKAKSRGEILLRSSEPTEYPRIIPNYLSDHSDIEAFIRSIRLYQKFLNTPTLSGYGAKLFAMPIPECSILDYDSDDYWDCYCRYMIVSGFHPVGTVKMGPDSDSGSIVDSRLKVKGVRNLRVIDSSIMPVITSGNINAPTIMIAEKGADFIKENWNTPV